MSNRIKVLDEELKQVDDELSGVLMTVPNLPDPSTPLGNSEIDNVVVKGGASRSRLLFRPSPTGRSARGWGSFILNGPPRSPAPASRSIGAPALVWSAP